jgi:hypothetical protein
MQERWFPVVGYEGFYEVSNCGRVRSITREVPYGRFGRTIYKGRMLKLTRIKNGYLTVKLALRGHTRTTYVHDMVLRAFVGPRPFTLAKGEIRHLDGVKTNNALSNLKYGDILENAADRVRHNQDRKLLKD